MKQFENNQIFSSNPEELLEHDLKMECKQRPSKRIFWGILTLLLTSTLIGLFIPANYYSQYAPSFYPPSTSQVGSKQERPEAKVFHRHQLVRQAQAQVGDEWVADVPASTESASAEPTSTRTVLECFQVAQPVISAPSLAAKGEDGETFDGPNKEDFPCTVTLMEYKFGNSYGQPFVGEYIPPPCRFNRVTLNFTAVSVGRQFDRLALMYLGDVEVWRTSTAEPTTPPGIRWEYHKDMTHFLSLWRQEQKIIFDLGNLVNDVYTGWFNTTLTATFFTVPEDEHNTYGASNPADLILPITRMLGSEGTDSRFTIPEHTAIVTIPADGFPRNANRAVFSISANGQADEEFWWSNTMESTKDTFIEALDGSLPGLSPWREVQVLVDGQLAGVYWPFPVIFTGGVSPGLHRPIVGIDAFDLREHEIDISPWLPLLCDGEEHTFQVQIAGLDDSGPEMRLTDQVADNWVVTGKIFIWLDEDTDSVTTGEQPTVNTINPVVRVEQQITKDEAGLNETLTYLLGLTRDLQIQARVTTSTSDEVLTWSQNIDYQQDGFIFNKGYGQINDMKINGQESLRNGDQYKDTTPLYRTNYQYPLYANSTYSIAPSGNLTIGAYVNQGLSWTIEGNLSSVHPTGMEAFFANTYTDQFVADVAIPYNNSNSKYRGAFVSTERDGTAWFFRSGDGEHSEGFGTTRQWFVFGAEMEVFGKERLRLYSRDVEAVNETVVRDEEMEGGYVRALRGKVIVQQQPGQEGGGGYAPARGRMGGGMGV